jgi:hypothetical protein
MNTLQILSELGRLSIDERLKLIEAATQFVQDDWLATPDHARLQREQELLAAARAAHELLPDLLAPPPTPL